MNYETTTAATGPHILYFAGLLTEDLLCAIPFVLHYCSATSFVLQCYIAISFVIQYCIIVPGFVFVMYLAVGFVDRVDHTIILKLRFG